MIAVLSGGGTAGHINPALALAEELELRGWQVKFAGTPHGVEARLVPLAGIEFKAFEASGFDRAHPKTAITGIRKIMKSTKEARAWFDGIHPDIVVGFGGYVSIPVARAAEAMGIPVVLHEQNSVMGMANKYLAPKAQAVCLTYAHAAQDLKKRDRAYVTGNPVRRAVIEADRAEGRARYGIADDELALLVFGGSLGARHLNEAICALKEKLLAEPKLRIVHITGPKEFESVTQALSLTPEEQKRWQVIGYEDQMWLALAAADAIVSRAGASSLAEISARAIPALLVPFPYATKDHQRLNALAYVEEGCAFMVLDDEVEGEHFRELLFSMIEDEDVRKQMHERAKAQAAARAAQRFADVVVAVSTASPIPLDALQ